MHRLKERKIIRNALRTPTNHIIKDFERNTGETEGAIQAVDEPLSALIELLVENKVIDPDPLATKIGQIVERGRTVAQTHGWGTSSELP